MDLLPRHGVAFAVLHLARVAGLAPRGSIDEWVSAALRHGSYMTAATDLRSSAHAMVNAGLASVGEQGEIRVGRAIAAVAASKGGARHAMRHAAVVLLVARPPAWLRVAVNADGVERVYIPQSDLDALSWLEEALDEVLVEARRLVGDADGADLSAEIGDAAEEIVAAALRAAGKQPVHVARISDAYGYDVDVCEGPVRFLEVKSAGPKTLSRFHLSRHEFDTSVRHGDAWCLVQVVFAGSAFVADPITAADVSCIRELPASALRALVPADSVAFRWQESALVTPRPDLWRPSALRPDPSFVRPGFAAGSRF
ncbi:protein NO VEIN domain-containing protein [Streptomyces rubiginosohelvolus]|uniref:protein NO VEIN domain-containing protein n=1 Tax=Streptomyces rubiginosohelvolus TaxID=67362 RepID=UPI0036F98A8E